MIGPTGVGKTEIARRLAALSGAPFVKVEATRYTEVGYHGRDVESMVRDLVKQALTLAQNRARDNVKAKASEAAEERLLDILLPAPEALSWSIRTSRQGPGSGLEIGRQGARQAVQEAARSLASLDERKTPKSKCRWPAKWRASSRRRWAKR